MPRKPIHWMGSDTADFNLANTYTVTINAPPPNNAILHVNAGAVSFRTDTGASRTYTMGTANLIGGNLSLIAPSSGSNTLTMVMNTNLGVAGGSQFSVTAGNDTSCGNLFIGTAVAEGTVVVDGSGSTLSVSGPTYVGDQGETGVLTFQNSAAGTFAGDIHLAFSASGTSGSVTVQSGADVTTAGNVEIGIQGGAAQSANITVAGTGSTFVQSGATTLTIGAASNSEGTLTVASGGTFTTGTGLTTVNDTGSINLSGGTFNANGSIALNGGSINLSGGTFNANGSITLNGGTFNFTSGSFNAPGSFVVGGAGPLGNNLTLSSGKSLVVSAATMIDAFSTLTLSGGSLTTSTLVNNGTFNFTGGTLTLTGGNGLFISSGGPLGDTVRLVTWQTINVTNTAIISTISSTGTLVLDDGRFNSTAGVTNNGEIRLAGAAPRITGGAITNNKLIRGDGRIDNNLTNASAGEIRAENGKTLLLTGANGVNSGEILLQGGTLDFSGALTNGANGFIAGRGVLYTGGLTNNGQMAFSGGNTDIHGDVTLTAGSRVVTSGAGATTTFFDDVVHNGTEIFTGAAGSTVFFGNQTGAGPFTGTGTVYYIGDLRPGNSPANVSYGGSLVLGSSTTLTMELGGTTPGGQYDRLTIAGSASLDGDLDMSLINGFTPNSGQQFTILTAGSINGTFDSSNLPALAGGLFFNIAYSTTAVTLSVAGILGDYNRNGIIDAPDYVLWRKTITQSGPALAADGNNNGTIDPADFTIWRASYGTSATGAGSNVTSVIPEPTSLLLLLVANACFTLAMQQRARRTEK